MMCTLKNHLMRPNNLIKSLKIIFSVVLLSLLQKKMILNLFMREMHHLQIYQGICFYIFFLIVYIAAHQIPLVCVYSDSSL